MSESSGGTTGKWLPRVALGLVLLPLVVSAFALLFDVGTSYVAGSDQGLIELRTRDVGRHAVLVGPYARDGWNHPGPALFYTLTPLYRLAGSHSIGLGLGALLINGLAVAGIAVIARRRGGLPFMLLTLVGCAVLLRSLGADFLRDPWNPYVAVLPFGFLVFLSWAMTCGWAWALPIGVGVASFCVQTHVGYAPIAIPLVVWGATWLVLTGHRRGDVREQHEHRAGDLGRAALVAVAVLVVMWLPPAVQQVTDSPGNLTEVVQDFREGTGLHHSIAEGYRVVSGQFGRDAQWLTGHVELDPFSGQPLLLYSSAPPVLLIPFGLAAVGFWRWRRSDANRLVATLILTLALGVFAVSRVTGPAYAYRLRWTWFLAVLALILVSWAGWMLIEKHARSTGSMRLLLAIPLSAVAVLGGVNSLSAARAGEPQHDISSAVHTVGPEVEAALPQGHGDVVVRSTTFEGEVYESALVLYLESRGVAVRVTRSRKDQYGDHRVHSSDAPTRASLTIAADHSFDETSARTDVRLVGYWGTKARKTRASIVNRRAEVQEAYDAGTITLDDLRRRLSSLEPGSSVGVFAET